MRNGPPNLTLNPFALCTHLVRLCTHLVRLVCRWASGRAHDSTRQNGRDVICCTHALSRITTSTAACRLREGGEPSGLH
jgi:hypothetical protein